MTGYSRYEQMRADGRTPVEVYRAAKVDALGEIEAIRMLRSVFQLSLGEAKEVMIVASGTSTSLVEHEEAVARELSSAVKRLT